MSIKQRLIKRQVAAAAPMGRKPMKRQAADDLAALYKREADAIIAEVEQALGGEKIVLVACDDYNFTDEGEAFSDFDIITYSSIDELVNDVAPELDEPDASVLESMGKKYKTADEFCKACHSVWIFGANQLWTVTEGQTFEAWKNSLYKEAEKAAAAHSVAAARKHSAATVASRVMARKPMKRQAADNNVELAKQAFEIIEQRLQPGEIMMVPTILIKFDKDTPEELVERWAFAGGIFVSMTPKEYLNDIVDVDEYLASDGQEYSMSPSWDEERADAMMDIYKKYKDDPDKFCEKMNEIAEWYNGPEFELAAKGKTLDEWEDMVLYIAEHEPVAASRRRVVKR